MTPSIPDARPAEVSPLHLPLLEKLLGRLPVFFRGLKDTAELELGVDDGDQVL